VKTEDVIIEPLALYEKHLNLFSLSFVQPLLDDLALKAPENLILTLGSSSKQSSFYRCFLVF